MPSLATQYTTARIRSHIFTHNGEHDIAAGTPVRVRYLHHKEHPFTRRLEPVYDVTTDGAQWFPLYERDLTDFAIDEDSNATPNPPLTPEGMTATTTERANILAALSSFANQKPGLDYGNYGDASAYRSECRAITNDLHDARELLATVSWREGITADDLKSAMARAFSGRLTWTPDGNGSGTLDYTTGQYFPTEYRKAACAVLATALWQYWATNMAGNQADKVRATARRELSRRVYRGYFAR